MSKLGRNIIVGLETALDGGSISIMENCLEIDSVVAKTYLSKSEDTFSLLEELLDKNNIKRSEIGSVAVSNGPGSFSGIRIGLAIAKGIGAILGTRVYEISILRAFVHLNPFIKGNVLAALYSERVGVFFQYLVVTDDGMISIEEDIQNLTFSDFANKIAGLKKKDLTLVFSEKLVNEIKEKFPNKNLLKSLDILVVKENFGKILALAAEVERGNLEVNAEGKSGFRNFN